MLKKKKRFFIPAVIAAATAFLALIGYIIIIFLGHYVIDEKKLILHACSRLMAIMTSFVLRKNVLS